MSFLNKVFEKEEIIEVRQVKVRKYKINWKRLFNNFLSLFMFWKKKPLLIARTHNVGNPEKVVIAKTKEEVFDLLRQHSQDIDKIKKQDSENTFKFSKDLVKWTVENSSVKEGFADGSLQENAVDGLKIHQNMKDNKK
jgi:hypothetical protein